MKALIDGDIVAFMCAASAENDDEAWIPNSRADNLIDRILQETEADEYEVWLSGDNNFRYQVYPEYKANRIDTYRPKWEKEVKEHLRKEWQANTAHGCEGDDYLGIRQYDLSGHNFSIGDKHSVICTIDKDLNQIPGWHYSWELTKLGKVIRPAKIWFITPEEATRFFYTQLLVGDPTDNIKGVPGIGPKKAEKLLQDTNPEEMLQIVRDQYSCDEELEMNAQVLYIRHKPEEMWSLNEAKIS